LRTGDRCQCARDRDVPGRPSARTLIGDPFTPDEGVGTLRDDLITRREQMHGGKGAVLAPEMNVLSVFAARRVVSPQHRDVQDRIGERNVQMRLGRALALVASGVPLSMNKVLLFDGQEGPRVEQERLEVIVGRSPRCETELTRGRANDHTPGGKTTGPVDASDAQLDEHVSTHQVV